jgi:hypothetical protein
MVGIGLKGSTDTSLIQWAASGAQPSITAKTSVTSAFRALSVGDGRGNVVWGTRAESSGGGGSLLEDWRPVRRSCCDEVAQLPMERQTRVRACGSMPSPGESNDVPLFLIERNFAEALGELTVDDVLGIQAINDDSEVRWIYSFLTGDRRKSYCLYEAPSADHIREAARRASVPADVIISVDQFDPVAFLGSASS